MAKLFKAPTCRRRGSIVCLANERQLFDQIPVEKLIEEWIVPQLGEQWIKDEGNCSTSESEDNG
jgi:hypothetical protein